MKAVVCLLFLSLCACTVPSTVSWKDALPPALFREPGQSRVYALPERKAAADTANIVTSEFGVYGDPTDQTIRVSIIGNVPRQGYFYVPKGTRLCDALIEAGGLESFWSPTRLQLGRGGKSFRVDLMNRTREFLSKVLEDGDSVVVPYVM